MEKQMKIYQASASINNNPILGHFSQVPSICAMRISSMFNDKNRIIIDREGNIFVKDIYSKEIRNISVENLIMKFSDFAKTFIIQEHFLNIQNPLKLVDCWQDDPIGSVGIQAIYHKDMSNKAIQELSKRLLPYAPYLTTEDKVYCYPTKQMSDNILKKQQNNLIFQKELLKRKQRSHALGQDFTYMQRLELVWLECTFIIKEWAEEYGYDSFFYKNHNEGNGENCFIPLKEGQVIKTNKSFTFSEERYQREMIFIIKNIAKNIEQYPQQNQRYFLWGYQDPMKYWKHKSTILSKLFSWLKF